MESKEEISDTDSGIILHYGPDSPTTVIKDVGTHTRAVKLKRQSLQDRLELCILELKKLCIREAELTGHLSSEYPLLPGEKPPQIRRRIGAAFKLDEQSILQRGEDSVLCSVEVNLALQQQIYVAARRLCKEEHLSKAVKRNRVQHCKQEEQKLKELQEAVFRLRLEHGRSSPHPGMISQKQQGASDDSSLSDLAVLDEEELTSQSSQASSELPPVAETYFVAPGPSYRSVTPTGPLFHTPMPSPRQPPIEHLNPCHSPMLEFDPAPIQNSPWKESSLDQPYQKQKKSHSSSGSNSPAVATLPPLNACLEEADLKLQMHKHTALRQVQSSSTPSTPEMHLRRGLSLRAPSNELMNKERDRGRSRGPRRRLTDVIIMTPECTPMPLAHGNQLYCSEDSNLEHLSDPSCISSPCREHPSDQDWLCQAQYRYHYTNHDPQSCTPVSYKNYAVQPSPGLYGGYMDQGRNLDMDMSRKPSRHQLSPHSFKNQYEDWYEDASLQQQRYRLTPPRVKLTRAPSLREYPQHVSRALPCQVVSDELKSWHQRYQQRPRPCSLDRREQSCVHIQKLPGHESPHSQRHCFQEEHVSQRQIIQRDITPLIWYEEDEIASQV